MSRRGYGRGTYSGPRPSDRPRQEPVAPGLNLDSGNKQEQFAAHGYTVTGDSGSPWDRFRARQNPQDLLDAFSRTTRSHAVDPASGIPYADAMMNLAARSAGVQTRNAADSLQGLNPLARVAGIARIARDASGHVGTAGMQGMSQGWNIHQGALDRTHGAQMDLLNRGLGMYGDQQRMLHEGVMQQHRGVWEDYLQDKRISAEERARREAGQNSWWQQVFSALPGVARFTYNLLAGGGDTE